MFIIATLQTLIIGCSNQSHLPTSNKDSFSPPGTVKVSDNFYCDQTEITNIGWQEYVYWNKNKLGETSSQYLGSLPDTTVWDVELEYGEPIKVNWFKHPAYRNYPIVGISKTQALNYTHWRTERVIEILLINGEIISSTTLDSISLAELLKSTEEIQSKLVPNYSLPTQSQISFINANYKSLKNEFEDDFGAPHGEKTCSVYCSNIHDLNTNAVEYLLDGTVGNVPNEYKAIHTSTQNKKALNMTSFRNVCSWITVEEYLKKND